MIRALAASFAIAAAATPLPQWKDQHSEAAQALQKWVQKNPDAARRLFAWDGAHPERTKALVDWALDKQRLALNDFAQWARQHSDAAKDLMEHPRGLEWAGKHLYGKQARSRQARTK